MADLAFSLNIVIYFISRVFSHFTCSRVFVFCLFTACFPIKQLTFAKMPPCFCTCSVPSHVDAVISTDQLNVSQHSIEPYLRTQAVTDVQSPPFGGSVTRGSVVVFCFGEWDPGLR